MVRGAARTAASDAAASAKQRRPVRLVVPIRSFETRSVETRFDSFNDGDLDVSEGGLLFTGIFSFGSLTLVQTNAAQAHLADAYCEPAGSPFYFENCWWRKNLPSLTPSQMEQFCHH